MRFSGSRSAAGRRLVRSVTAAAAMSLAIGWWAPGVASAQPEATADEAMAAMIDAAPADPASAAAEAIAAVADPTTGTGSTQPAISALDSAVRALGLQPFFWPTVALGCSAVDGVPLSAVPAMAASAPGPYAVPIPGLPDVLNPDLVGPGEAIYAFVPAGVVNDPDTTGMQVAWFNLSTLQGGFVEMSGFTRTLSDAILAQFPEQVRGQLAGPVAAVVATLPSAGVRLAPVQTGSGTILAAVFGQIHHGDKTCLFLPSVGVTQVP